MTVHSCFVDDGLGEKVDLVDADGCALDKFLLGNLEYPTDLMAGVAAHVFKYADRAQLYFQCQITILVKVRIAASETTFSLKTFIPTAEKFNFCHNNLFNSTSANATLIQVSCYAIIYSYWCICQPA